jgi:hypothetical protein
MTSEFVTAELDDVFDLDIQVDDLCPVDPDRSYRAASFDDSCTFCCPSSYCPPSAMCVTGENCN